MQVDISLPCCRGGLELKNKWGGHVECCVHHIWWTFGKKQGGLLCGDQLLYTASLRGGNTH